MQKLLSTAPLLALVLTACNYGPAAAAQDSDAKSIQVNVSSSHRSYTCHNPGDSVQVTGSSNVLTITGNCGSLQVTGSSNAITIDGVQTVQFTSSSASNAVFYRNGHRPTSSNNGQNNSLGRATGQMAAAQGSADASGSVAVNDGSTAAITAAARQAAAAASAAAGSIANNVQGVQVNGNTLNIILSGQQTTQDCGNGRFVNINGYQNDITLTGSCSKIVLNGWGNTVHIEETGAIEVGGHTNKIFWQRGRNVSKPVVQIDSGMDNTVRHEVPANQ